jgi:hypothetical protein
MVEEGEEEEEVTGGYSTIYLWIERTMVLLINDELPFRSPSLLQMRG